MDHTHATAAVQAIRDRFISLNSADRQGNGNGSDGGLFLLALQPEGRPYLDRLLAQSENELVDDFIVPDYYHYALIKGHIDNWGELPGLSLGASPTLGWRGAVKRAMDLVLGIPILITVTPLMLLIAAAIKLTSPGPALFFQRRITLDGRVFNLAKFRTMHVGSENNTGPIWAKFHDPRCTALGHFLRWVSLDELPQLWHVVTGKMSLVGPRPERPVFVEQFGAELPGYKLRHTIKAGLTGWAQINGWRGDTSIEKRLEYDLDYIKIWSPLLDLKIIWRTIMGGFLNRRES